MYDVVIIGGGPGGYAAALYAHNFGLNVALVEKDRVGGTCLLRGCIPAKTWLKTAEVYMEGWDEDEDDGDGVFRRRTYFDNIAGWVGYVVGMR